MPISIFRAGETIAAGNIVAVTQNSVVKKASVNDPETFRAIGVATTSGYAGDAVKVVVDDQVHIFSGLTPGSQLYLSPTPGLYTTSYSTITSGVGVSLNGSANLAPFARAISASGIALQTPAAVVADVSSETITLEGTPNANIFNFLTEYNFKVVKESGTSIYTPLDPDAAAYTAAVETADGQTLENEVKVAINNFVLGCKADGLWTAIKASCILAGARTLNGCLVPLVGTAPTNNNFVPDDYNRRTGLVGNGSTKSLDSNRNNTADPQNNKHLALYPSSLGAINKALIGSAFAVGASTIFRAGISTNTLFRANNQTAITETTTLTPNSIVGVSRSASGSINIRYNQTTFSRSSTSETPTSGTILVFNETGTSFHSDARIAFYSIGESLDLAKLDARVSTLMNDFAAAIP